MEALNELSLAHFADTGVDVRRDIGADGDHCADPERLPAGVCLAGERLAFIHWCVASGATGGGDQIAAPFQFIIRVNCRDVARGRGRAGNQIVDRKIELGPGQGIANGGQRVHVGDQRLHIAIAHFREVLIRHHGEQRPAVAADPFANGADLFAVRPGADSGLNVGGDVSGDHVSEQADFLGKLPAASSSAGDDGRAELRQIALRMAAVAIGENGEQVFAACDVFRRHAHLNGFGRQQVGAAKAEVGKAAAADRRHRAGRNEQYSFPHVVISDNQGAG